MASERMRAFDAAIVAPAERRQVGRSVRSRVPRTAHAVWEAPADRRDPIETLAEQNRSRDPQLVPVRLERMAASPFAFLRGAALVMAHDLATTPSSGLHVQLCGDAHLLNFGVFNSPERRLVFDLNDFDETAPGPFEWDVKRLAASIVVAARAKGLDRVAARRAVIEAVSAYQDWMERYSAMTHLDVWYSRLEVAELLDLLDPSLRRSTTKRTDRAVAKNHLKALDKLTTMVDGRRRIVDDPPLVEHVTVERTQSRLESVFRQYRSSLASDRRALFDQYRFVDFARKVVGVGSVGTRCWIGLFQGPNGGPLFLQVKEARAAAPDLAVGRDSTLHAGRRVVEGQRLLQATPDVLLGWATDRVTGIQYYVRQLWDAKGSVDVETMSASGFPVYAGWCGWALARGHARTGDSSTISGYLGSSARFAEAVADFAEAYADQTERDHAALIASLA
jgi:uncharacterized protein (DUF2252 family)